MPYLIDGHNLRGMILGCDEVFAPVTEAELCRLVDGFLGARGEVGELVFDGTGPPNRGALGHGRQLRVCFAGAGTDADTVIESRIHVCPEARRLVVVSDDRRLRAAARTYHCQSLRCEPFWRRVVAQSQRRPARRDPLGKRHGLGPSETEQWLDTFGLKGEPEE